MKHREVRRLAGRRSDDGLGPPSTGAFRSRNGPRPQARGSGLVVPGWGPRSAGQPRTGPRHARAPGRWPGALVTGGEARTTVGATTGRHGWPVVLSTEWCPPATSTTGSRPDCSSSPWSTRTNVVAVAVIRVRRHPRGRPPAGSLVVAAGSTQPPRHRTVKRRQASCPRRCARRASARPARSPLLSDRAHPAAGPRRVLLDRSRA
jgi:hypothetical protein